MVDQARQGADQAKSYVQGAMDQARQGAEQAAEYVQGAVEQARDKLADYRDGGLERLKTDVIGYTREQPGLALLLAAGAGLMVGWLTAAGRR